MSPVEATTPSFTVVVNKSPVEVLTNAQSASTVPSTPVGGIAATNVQAALAELDAEKETPSAIVARLATGGAGTSASPWTGWEAGVNALPVNSDILFGFGHYTQTTAILTKRSWRLRGMGKEVSVVTSAFTGSAIRSVSPINGSTAVHLVVEDLGLTNTNAANTAAGIEEVAGTFVHINRCRIQGFKYGVIFDQTELGDIDLCDIEAQVDAGAGVWLTDGPQWTPGASAGFTNRISIKRCQFNEPATVNGIVDDGGYAHTIEDNNFNGCLRHIRYGSVTGGRIAGNEFESATQEPILVLSGPSGGAAVNLLLLENVIIPTAGKSAVVFNNGSPVVAIDNFISSTAAGFAGLVNCFTFAGFGNYQSAAGALYDGRATNHIVIDNTGLDATTLKVNGTAFKDFLPWLIDIDAATATPVSHVTFDTTQYSAVIGGGLLTSSGAQNSESNWDVVLAAGTWTLELMHYRHTDRGAYSVQLDGVEVGTIDGYNAAALVDAKSTVAGIVVAATGKKRLKLKMATKNASSSNFVGAVQHIQLRRTA